jgi:hypothetical protein
VPDRRLGLLVGNLGQSCLQNVNHFEAAGFRDYAGEKARKVESSLG